MKDDRIPKQLLFGELARGTRDNGRPPKRWKDCAKDDLKSFNIDYNSWFSETQGLFRATTSVMLKDAAKSDTKLEPPFVK